jgi:hypothetical protein
LFFKGSCATITPVSIPRVASWILLLIFVALILVDSSAWLLLVTSLLGLIAVGFQIRSDRRRHVSR